MEEGARGYEWAHSSRNNIQHLLQVVGHKNQDKVPLGLGSAKDRSRRGDNHFLVIRHHKFSGDVCFLI
jgi:hypothetical protein